jgi:hypothetical protein
MDIVSAWKATSIALTGAFGVLGMLTDNKDKISGRLTKWGRISLSGIIVSSLCGVAAQIKETSDEGARREDDGKKTLALVQQTGEAVGNIQRLLSPIEDPVFTMSFEASCKDKFFFESCENARKFKASWPKEMGTVSTLASASVWSLWPGGGHGAIIPLHLYFFRNPPDVAKLEAGISQAADMSFDIISTNYANDKSLGMTFDTPIEKVEVHVFSYKPFLKENKGNINSTLDIPGSTVILTELNDILNSLTPNWFVMETKQGRKIEIAGAKWEKISIDGNTAYRYRFPLRK